MKQKKLIFNFFVNRNWKKLTDSRKRAKILADNRKGHHPIETLLNPLWSPSRLNHVIAVSFTTFFFFYFWSHSIRRPDIGTTDQIWSESIFPVFPTDKMLNFKTKIKYWALPAGFSKLKTWRTSCICYCKLKYCSITLTKTNGE